MTFLRYLPKHHIRVEFKPQDLWIGVFWKKTELPLAYKLDIWVCLIPMVPIHYRQYHLNALGKSYAEKEEE